MEKYERDLSFSEFDTSLQLA